MKTYYTYILINSINSQPFYVGKGVRSRMYQHKRDALNPNYCHRSVHRKIQSVMNKGGDVLYKKVGQVSESAAFESEIKMIEQYGRKDLGTGILCNLTDGGDGGSKVNPESVERRAAKHRGMKRSEESKKLMSEVQKELAKERQEQYGWKKDPKSEATRVAKRTGVPWSEVARNVKRNKPTAKSVLVHKKTDSVFVGEYESISLCGKELQCDITTIWKICEGKPSTPAPNGKVYPMKSHKGYTFQYKD